MTVPANDKAAFSLARGMNLGLHSTQSKNHKMSTAERPWCGALGEFGLQLPHLDTSHRDCSCVDFFGLSCSGAFYFSESLQNAFLLTLHFFLLRNLKFITEYSLS